MRAVTTRNMTRRFGPPKGWDEERDGLCDTIEVRIQSHGQYAAFVSTWKPSADEIRHLIEGGVIEVSILGAQPALRLDVVDAVEDAPARKHITINEEAHGL